MKMLSMFIKKIPAYNTGNCDFFLYLFVFCFSRVKQRSRAMVAAKFKKDNTKDKKKHCLFFCRFGRCSRGDRCQYVHDPEKVAVCTRWNISLISYLQNFWYRPACLLVVRFEFNRDYEILIHSTTFKWNLLVVKL